MIYLSIELNNEYDGPSTYALSMCNTNTWMKSLPSRPLWIFCIEFILVYKYVALLPQCIFQIFIIRRLQANMNIEHIILHKYFVTIFTHMSYTTPNEMPIKCKVRQALPNSIFSCSCVTQKLTWIKTLCRPLPHFFVFPASEKVYKFCSLVPKVLWVALSMGTG